MSGDSLHVLTITPFYPIVGDDAKGCFVAEPLRWLERLGVRHTVLAAQPFYRATHQSDPSAPLARTERFFALPGGFGLPSSGLFLFAKMINDVRRIHKADHIHLIHAHSALPCGHAAALLARELNIPFVVTVHGLDAYSTSQVKGIAGSWCQRISRMVYRSACRVICVSEKVREQVVQGAASPLRTTVIYNGVDPDVFTPEVGRELEVILSVGGLIPIKGHELLIRAFAAIVERFPGCSCELIGDGPEQKTLERLALQLKIAETVRFSGRQSRAQVVEAMRRCAIFALPSRYEALGCVYLEAMSSGKPVVACRGQGIEEVIRDGRDGYLVDTCSIEGLSNTLAGLLEDQALRRCIGAAARQTVASGFTLAHQAESLVQSYKECAQ
jgi:glycosyltransferase involved in cell wall biosynthesis